MSATTIFAIAIIGAGVLTVLGIFAIAIRRGPSAGPITSDEIEGTSEPVAQEAPPIKVGTDDVEGDPAAVATIAEVSTEPPVDPLTEKETLTPAEYGVTRRKFLNRALYAVFGLFLAQFALGALMLIPLTAVAEGWPSDITALGWLLLLYLGLVGSVLPFLTYYWVLKHVTVTRAQIIAYLVPLVALTSGIIVLDEKLEIGIAVGGGLILLGVIITGAAERRFVRA